MRLKLFLFQRTDNVGYDEVAGQLIAARTETRARAISAISNYPKVKIRRIGLASSEITREGELLQDFRAG